MNNTTKPNLNRFYIISVLALIWNIFGVIAYLGQVYMTDETKQSLSADQQAYYTNLPAWATGAFAVAVFAGTLGCLLLLLKKSYAVILFWISLIGIVVQFSYNFLIQKDMPIPITHYIWPIVVFGIAIFLIWFAKRSKEKGYLK